MYVRIHRNSSTTFDSFSAGKRLVIQDVQYYGRDDNRHNQIDSRDQEVVHSDSRPVLAQQDPEGYDRGDDIAQAGQ